MNPYLALLLLLLLLVGPIVAGPLERNIELFFFAVGILACMFSRRLDRPVIEHAARAPLLLTAAVLGAGTLFSLLRLRLERFFDRLHTQLSPGALTAAAVLVIAAASCLITAIVAALLLAEVVGHLRLPANSQIRVAVAGCFAIGLGSALTPMGGPLSALAIAALRMPFWGLLGLLGWPVAIGVVLSSVLAGILAHHNSLPGPVIHPRIAGERSLLLQAAKVYLFVAGLVLVSEGFAPVARRYVAAMGPAALYWLNSISALVDNSTLVAIELPGMDPVRARAALIGLLIAGGMLIPGNIPNIICAGSMRIGSLAWARLGIPLGILLMLGYFLALGLGR